MGKVRRGGNKAQVAGKKKGGVGPKSSGVIKRTSVKVASICKKQQPGKKFKPARVTHKHHTKEALFEPVTTVLALSAEE